MQYAERLNRRTTDALYDKQPVEPKTPEKPPYIDERPHQPQKGQTILTDEKK